MSSLIATTVLSTALKRCFGTWLVCAIIASSAIAHAAPGVTAKDALRRAEAAERNGEPEKALAAIQEGLATAPKDSSLLYRKGRLLLLQRDYLGALEAYEACLDSGITGARRREVERNVKSLSEARTTFLEVTVSNGPASVYLENENVLFCTAAPSCNKPLISDTFKVIAERPGFERWTGNVTVTTGQTTKLAITLVEKPSLLSVRVTPPGARVVVDGAPHTAGAPVPAGTRTVVVTLERHAEVRREVIAREGKPLDLEVVLTPLLPIEVKPAQAVLTLDDQPIAVVDGGLPVPPGPRVLIARAQGYQDRRIEIPAERPADYKIEVELVRVPLAIVRSDSPFFTPRRKLALASGGVAVLAVTGGVFLGLKANSLDDDALALCPIPSACATPDKANDLNDRARSRALQANIAYGVAAASAGAAVLWWITGAPKSSESREPRVAIRPRLGAITGLDLSATF
jgi:hypothetical protein